MDAHFCGDEMAAYYQYASVCSPTQAYWCYFSQIFSSLTRLQSDHHIFCSSLPSPSHSSVAWNLDKTVMVMIKIGIHINIHCQHIQSDAIFYDFFPAHYSKTVSTSTLLWGVRFPNLWWILIPKLTLSCVLFKPDILLMSRGNCVLFAHSDILTVVLFIERHQVLAFWGLLPAEYSLKQKTSSWVDFFGDAVIYFQDGILIIFSMDIIHGNEPCLCWTNVLIHTVCSDAAVSSTLRQTKESKQ